MVGIRQAAMAFVVSLWMLQASGLAGDWPHFMGPNSNNTAPDKGINKDWKTNPPKELWRITLTDSLGGGSSGAFAGPCIVGGKLFINDHNYSEDCEIVRAIDVKTGKDIWQYKYPTTFKSWEWGFTASVPACDGKRVYTLDREGQLHCIDAEKGTRVWMRNLAKQVWTSPAIAGHSDFYTSPVIDRNPGIYVMDWKEPQKTCGLSIKEIDGATAEIDVWQGAVPGDVPMEGETLDKNSNKPGWRNVAAYEQKRRFSAYGNEMNRFACYMDGYVDFRETIETRAIRIRITGQWLDNGADSRCRRHDGRYEHGTHATQVYCLWLDTRVCKIMGVAPLSPLGDDPLSDPLAFGRLEILDATNGKPVKELPLRAGGDGISFAPDGKLYVIGPDENDICRVDLDSGKLTSVIRDTLPATFTIGLDGLFYVASSNDGAGASPILVYDAQGKKVREIGKAGGFRPGLWDPQRFGKVKQMCVDQAGSLWVVESQDRPRRIVQYKTDGTFVKELLGNTQYGGGGTLDRTDPSRAFYKGMEFEIDLKKHSSRLQAWFGQDVLGSDLIMRSCDKRLYLTTAPGGPAGLQSVGVVYLYNEKEGTVRLAAAIGDAGCFPLLWRSDILSLLPSGYVPSLYQFVWSDLNGNGRIDTDEIDFRYKLVSDGARVPVKVGRR